MSKSFKSKIKSIVATFFSFALVACGGTNEGGNENGGNNGGNQSGKEPGKGAYVETIKSDWVALVEGAAAYDDWCADKYYYEYKFDKDGKCEYYRTYYNFPDTSKYEEANDRLESGNWKPTWASDHTNFYTSSSYISTMTPEKAVNNLDEKYFAYTITYSDKATKSVPVPSAEQQAADLLANLGVSKETFNIAPGSNPVLYNQTKVQVGCKLVCEGANKDLLNQYARGLFDALKAVADGNKIYDYIDYSMEITECPQVGSEFESVYFMYRVKGNKFNVKVGQNENQLYAVIQISK